MENATDALYMGFAIIAFVVALSLSIFSFSEVTSASQRIIDARDKTTLYNYYTPNGTSRTVTREDIIPTLYRAYYENYLVTFKGLEQLGMTEGFYKIKNQETNQFEKSFTIDLAGQSIANHDDADKLITALLQGNLGDLFSNNDGFHMFQHLQNISLYGILERNTFKEEIGLYYQEDVDGKKEGLDEVNKTRKRIITYTYIPNTDND